MPDEEVVTQEAPVAEAPAVETPEVAETTTAETQTVEETPQPSAKGGKGKEKVQDYVPKAQFDRMYKKLKTLEERVNSPAAQGLKESIPQLTPELQAEYDKAVAEGTFPQFLAKLSDHSTREAFKKFKYENSVAQGWDWIAKHKFGEGDENWHKKFLATSERDGEAGILERYKPVDQILTPEQPELAAKVFVALYLYDELEKLAQEKGNKPEEAAPVAETQPKQPVPQNPNAVTKAALTPKGGAVAPAGADPKTWSAEFVQGLDMSKPEDYAKYQQWRATQD